MELENGNRELKRVVEMLENAKAAEPDAGVGIEEYCKGEPLLQMGLSEADRCAFRSKLYPQLARQRVNSDSSIISPC